MYTSLKYNRYEHNTEQLPYDFNHMLGLLTKRWAYQKAKVRKKRTEAVIDREFLHSRIMDYAGTTHTHKEVADIVGCHRATVARVFKRHNKLKKDTKQYGIGKDKRARIIQSAKSTHGKIDRLAIVSEFGVSYHCVTNILLSAGIPIERMRVRQIMSDSLREQFIAACVGRKGMIKDVAREFGIDAKLAYNILLNNRRKIKNRAQRMQGDIS